MKVLQVIPTLNPTAGGPVEGLIQQGIEMTHAGHVVFTACLDVPGMPLDPRIQSAQTFQLGPSRLTYGFSVHLEEWLHMNLRSFEVVVIHGMWTYHAYCTAKVARALGVPYVVFLHGMLDPWFARKYPLKHLKKWLYWPWAEYRTLRDARLVLFTTAEELRLARQSFWLYKARERLVGYGIRAPQIQRDQARSEFLLRFPGLVEKRNVLYLSRLHPKKGCDLLIKAFAKVAELDSRLHLVLAGPGDAQWTDKLKLLAQKLRISNRVTFTGMLTGAAKWGAYDCSEVFVLPSHQENFGIVVAEALARGLPVLTTPQVNIWREIEDAGAGLIRPDTQAGADQMLDDWVALTSDQRDLMRLAASRCFYENFDIRNVAKNLVQALEDARFQEPEKHSFTGSFFSGSFKGTTA